MAQRAKTKHLVMLNPLISSLWGQFLVLLIRAAIPPHKKHTTGTARNEGNIVRSPVEEEEERDGKDEIKVLEEHCGGSQRRIVRAGWEM